MTCKIKNCDRRHQARGWCKLHYERWRKFGDPEAYFRKGRKPGEPPRPCRIDGCDKDAIARALCDKHYRKWKLYGDPLEDRTYRRDWNAPCSVDGCGEPYVARGLCGTHYAKWRNHGDPLAEFGAKWRMDKQGYMRKFIPGHPMAQSNGVVHQHRLVMSEHLDRPLLSTEHVHHKNGIRHDNRIENLELWSKAHPRGARVTDLLQWAHDFIEQYGDQPQLWPEGLAPPK